MTQALYAHMNNKTIKKNKIQVHISANPAECAYTLLSSMTHTFCTV
jgi:hypothetical protein